MRTAAIIVGLSLFAIPSIAAAQPVRPLIPITSSDTLTLPDARDVNALTPIRLGLLAHSVPHSLGTPGCEPMGRATGMSPMANNTVAANGLHIGGLMHGIGLPAVPFLSNMRLTLFGFSRDGCAYDQALGGGLALTVPIRKDVAFMWGGGAIYLPKGDPGAQPRAETEMRAAVVWTTRDGRSYNVGLSAGMGVPRVSFGGVF
jgi:hypothetical protein